jgi:iron complex outermembrane receptor protein
LSEVHYAEAPAALYGYEVEMWLPIAGGASSTWRVRMMSDYVRGARDDGEPLPQMPALRLGAGLHFDQAAWHAALEAIHTGDQNRLAANELATASYLMLNADISYRLESTSGAWLFFLRGTNLLDEEARQSTASLKDRVPMPGRSLHGGVRVTF